MLPINLTKKIFYSDCVYQREMQFIFSKDGIKYSSTKNLQRSDLAVMYVLWWGSFLIISDDLHWNLYHKFMPKLLSGVPITRINRPFGLDEDTFATVIEELSISCDDYDDDWPPSTQDGYVEGWLRDDIIKQGLVDVYRQEIQNHFPSINKLPQKIKRAILGTVNAPLIAKRPKHKDIVLNLGVLRAETSYIYIGNANWFDYSLIKWLHQFVLDLYNLNV